MSLLTLDYGSGAGNLLLKRSPICHPGTTVFSLTHAMTSTLGTNTWFITCPIASSASTQRGIVYICYLPDSLYLVVPERTCKIICEAPVSNWNVQALPKSIWLEFNTWSHVNTFVGYYNFSNYVGNLTQVYLSKFQFLRLLKPWNIDDI